MDAKMQRRLGARLAGQIKAVNTQCVIGKADSGYKDILDAAAAELSLDDLVTHVLQGPAEWAYQALRHVPNLSPQHREALIHKASEEPLAAVYTLRFVPDLGTQRDAVAQAAGSFAQSLGNISGFYLNNKGSYNCEFTMYWTDGGKTQPAAGTPGGGWKWSSRLMVGMDDTLGCLQFKLADSPLQAGDEVWMYMWVQAGQDIESPLRFTYDPSTSNHAYFTSSGCTQSDSLALEKVAPGATYLGINEQQQQQDQWCWSASTVSITLYLDSTSTWTQCSLVNRAFKQTTCCQNGSSQACNQPWYANQALTITGHLASSNNSKPAFQTIVTEINAGHPISIAIFWTGGGGHNPVVDGYDGSNATSPVIDIQDPWYGQSTHDFNTFPASYHGGASWGASYFTH